MRSMFKLLLFCALVGALVCAYHNHWFILLLPRVTADTQGFQAEPESKQISLIWWQDNQWKKESVSMLWPVDICMTSELLIRTWLQVTAEEKNEQYEALLQAVLLSASRKTLFVSFVKSPFNKQWSMQEKLVWIEGLCRTLQANGIPATHIQFLIDHKLFFDPHLEFSCAWPIGGYLSVQS